MGYIYILDLIGTFVFAISGALIASKKQFDAFGTLVIAFVTAVGGGTLRDMMIGSTPVGWMNDTNYIIIVGLGLITSILFKKYIRKLSKTMFLFDTIGIGLFTILGLQKTLGLGLSPMIAVIMGMVSAVFGGVVRDTLTNEVPLVFRKEVYATACLLGGILYLILDVFHLEESWKIAITVLVIMIIRILAVKRKWALPLPVIPERKKKKKK